MFSKIALLAIAAMISGCAAVGTTVAEKGSLTRLKGQTVTLKVDEPSGFILSTPETNRTYLRAVVMVREGNALVRTNNVGDPANGIATGVAQKLRDAYGVTLAPATTAAYSINVQTTNWGLFLTGSDKNKFGVLYMATFQLVDLKKGSVVASGNCKPDEGAGPRIVADKEQLLSLSAQGLKNALGQSVNACVQHISNQILAM